ncbi:MAG: glycosyltransferase [Pirellulales bacterium]
MILQRKLLPLWQLHRLRRYSRVLLYDFDDAQFCRDSYSRKSSTSWTRLANFWATIYAADGVIAGNPFLAEQAGAYVGPEKVHLVPTCVAPQTYGLADHVRRGSGVRLVWIGQHSTLPGLYLADPLLEAAGARTPGLELRVVCNQFPRLHGVRVVPRQWSQAGEARELADADIGVSYLPDDEWSRGKCGLKVLQYMAAGLPVVANPVGMNCEMVEHGVTGFLAHARRMGGSRRKIGGRSLVASSHGRRGAQGRRVEIQRESLGAALRRTDRAGVPSERRSVAGRAAAISMRRTPYRAQAYCIANIWASRSRVLDDSAQRTTAGSRKPARFAACCVGDVAGRVRMSDRG